jgi:hypothetical protein
MSCLLALLIQAYSTLKSRKTSPACMELGLAWGGRGDVIGSMGSEGRVGGVDPWSRNGPYPITSLRLNARMAPDKKIAM